MFRFEIDAQCLALLGRRIVANEMLARWALSELRSSRFSDQYRSDCGDICQRDAADGIRFDDLPESEQMRLVGALVRYRSRLLRGIRRSETATFVLECWCKEELLTLRVLPALGAVSLREFAATPITPQHDEQVRTDPRTAAAEFGADEPFIQREGICTIDYLGDRWLVDGTLRSLLFLRSEDPNARILVWVGRSPESGQQSLTRSG